ncbi:hypothetical protein FACS1894187_13350 [Synergistales bacterium]|nr:hypothetical protein FACS1894187_13350 [Synergistales bacterium]
MHKLPPTSKDWQDVILFGQVLSLGLLVGGYIFAGVCVKNWLSGREAPYILIVAATPVFAFFGLWQGWLLLSHINKSRKK